jgi:NAD(P)-dependent dehydrogenase (short-subunit alcohol dehydrogenase family)
MDDLEIKRPVRPKVWFITGCLAGMGRHLAEAVLKRGDKAVVTARDLTKFASLPGQYPGSAMVILLDVARSEMIASAVAQAIEQFGRIDVLVNNAGYGLQGALEEVTMEQIRRQFDTNFFGMVEVTKGILPHMREARSGHIVNIASGAGGLVTEPKLGAYHATKFAVEGLSESLAQEVEPLGIKVTVVELGAQHTDWWGNSLIRTENIIDDYTQRSGSLRHLPQTGSRRVLNDPGATAEAIVQITDLPAPPLHLVLGEEALAKVRRKLADLQRELDGWEHLSQALRAEEDLP